MELQEPGKRPGVPEVRRDRRCDAGALQAGELNIAGATSPAAWRWQLTVSQGLFSGNPQNKFQVDKEGLRKITTESLAEGLQSKPGNAMAGIEGRAALLPRLAHALDTKREFFGEDGRPGNMIGKFVGRSG